jgi:hypothetical protein
MFAVVMLCLSYLSKLPLQQHLLAHYSMNAWGAGRVTEKQIRLAVVLEEN